MSEPKQSAFVTVVAWLAILGAAYAAFAGLVQVGMLAGVPDGTRFVAFAVGRTVLACAALACAFGLLRRREWARKGMVVVLTLAVALIAVMALAGLPTPNAVIAAAWAGVMIWLAVRLNARTLKAEFR
jgi:hypothetical protein